MSRKEEETFQICSPQTTSFTRSAKPRSNKKEKDATDDNDDINRYRRPNPQEAPGTVLGAEYPLSPPLLTTTLFGREHRPRFTDGKTNGPGG